MSEPKLARTTGGLPPRHHPPRDFDADPMGALDEGLRRYGPAFRIDLDGVDTVLLGTWAGLGDLFAAERGRLQVLNTPLVHDLFGRALFNLTGDAHTEARHRLRPALSGRSLPGYATSLLEVTGPVTAGWARHGAEDLYAAAREVTLAMSARVLLGLAPGDPDAAVFAADFERFVAATGAPAGRRRFTTRQYWAGLGARRRLHALFARCMAAAQARPCPGSALSAMAVGFQDAPKTVGPLTDHLLALLIAARETTASLITWSLIELAQHRERALAAVGEARAAAADPRSLTARDGVPVLRAVLAETQRLHSPNLLSVRQATCPVRLAGYRLPAGTRVAYSTSAGHFDPDAFPQPHAFRPDRFPGGQAAGARLWAFGGGAHACLGRPLAELMALTVLASTLDQGLPRLPDGPPTRIRYRPAKAPLDPVPFVLDPLEPAL